MRTILEQIFEDYKFEKVKLVNTEEYDYFSSCIKSENYLVYYLDSFSKEEVYKILDFKIYNIKFLDNIDKEKQKNTSVLFIVKFDNRNLTDEDKEQILLIEEDPYFYKKYVLWYLEDEIRNIRNALENMTKTLMNRKMFEKMKKSMSKEIEYDDDVSAYSLLCRIFIKLPFLTLKSIYDEEDELQLTKQKIDACIDKNKNLYNELEKEDINIDIELSNQDMKKYLDMIEKDISEG